MPSKPPAANAVISIESLLEEMLDYDSVARWPEPAFTCVQASSYDRRRKAPDQADWFIKSSENFVRVDEVGGRKCHVMMDAAGPGAIVRLYLTSHCPKPGKLRIYLDGAPTPVLEYDGLDLMLGEFHPGEPLQANQPSYGVFEHLGNTSYLPIPYARRCLVTWEEPDGGPATPTVCYQINYRTYDPSARVQTLTRNLLARAGETIRRVNRTLSAPPAPVGAQVHALEQTIAPGGSVTMALPPGAAAVRQIGIHLRRGEEHQPNAALHSTVISAEFDGEQTVWCPMGDFFGAGPGLSFVHSWYRTVSVYRQMVCRWVMPYAKSATLTFHNFSDQPLTVQAEVMTSEWAWDDRSMHFHANWKFEAGIPCPPLRDWNFIETRGRGVYVGDTLAIFNPIASWYGEGTEKIWVDAEGFPTHMGTGNEDYYNFSWAPRATFNLPFASHVRSDEIRTQGHNVLTRTRNLDGIPFRQRLRMDVEVNTWKPSELDYAATTYWYALPGATSNVSPAPAAAARAVPCIPLGQA